MLWMASRLDKWAYGHWPWWRPFSYSLIIALVVLPPMRSGVFGAGYLILITAHISPYALLWKH